MSLCWGKAQKVCNVFTQLTGHTKFWLEMLVIVIENIFNWVFAVQSANAVVFILAVIMTLSSFVSVRYVNNAEKEFLKNGKLTLYKDITYKKGFRYLLFNVLAFIGIGDVVFGFSLLNMFGLLWIAALIVERYISECTSLPPRKSKIKNGMIFS